MSAERWRYPEELLTGLAEFGLAPTPHTPPRLVREQLSDLYRHEIRRLRARLLAGDVPKADYAGHVVALRKKYWPLSFTPEQLEKICTDTRNDGNERELRERREREDPEG